MKCILCGAEISEPIKEWNYRKNYYQVKLYECPNCSMTFKCYYHDGEFSHTIPKYIGITRKIESFLGLHGDATVEEIANNLELKLEDVLNTLSKLKEEQRIESVACKVPIKKKNH
jgi:hypothetical protein